MLEKNTSKFIEGGSDNLYKSLFEFSNEGIFIIDKLSKKIIDLNQAAAGLLLYKKEELVGQPISSIYPEKVIPFLQTKISKLIENGNVNFEIQQQKKDGSLVDVEIKSSVFMSNEQEVFQSIVTDVTKRKEFRGIAKGII